MRVARTIAVAAILGLFVLGADLNDSPDTKATEAAKALLEKKLPEVKFNANELSDVIDFMHDVTGANIYVDWQSLKSVNLSQDTQVTCNATDTKFGDVLNQILSSASGDPKKLVFCADGGVIFISTPDAQKPHRDSWRKHREMPTDKLKFHKPTLAEVRFNANSFSDVLDFMRDITGDDIKVDWDQLHQNGIERDTPITLRLKDAQPLLVLQMIAENASTDKAQVDYKIDGGTIEFFAVAEKQQ